MTRPVVQEAQLSLASPNSASLQMRPSEMEALLAAKLSEVCAGIAAWALPVVVVGILGEIPEARYGTAYKIPLIDPDASTSTIYLNIKEAVLVRAGVRCGDLVRVVGPITAELFRGNVSFRLVAVAIECQAATVVPEARSEHLTLETLRRLMLSRRPFPSKAWPTITLIHSAASSVRVADDFVGALGSEVPSSSLVRVPCSMHDAEALAAAIRNVRTDILAIVRGGGEPEEFCIFEHANLLESLANCSSYRILGLGHTANRTMAELVADHAASTPSAAGEHVRRAITEAMQLAQEKALNKGLREALAEKELQIEQSRQPLRFEPPEEDTFRPGLVFEAERRLTPVAAWWVLLGVAIACVFGRLV